MKALGSTPLAALLYRRRRDLRLSRPAVQRSTGFPQVALDTWERGTVPRIDKAMILARLYGISFDELAEAAGVPDEVAIVSWEGAEV